MDGSLAGDGVEQTLDRWGEPGERPVVSCS